ncbi:MAG: hypothetical protein KF749_12675 [Bacteroidetes bacterium]|nr:hypothetical protein [Bacteroidota bacterium]MCW5897123.1 hypothetical protein [Bacteroidota bacterium]
MTSLNYISLGLLPLVAILINDTGSPHPVPEQSAPRQSQYIWTRLTANAGFSQSYNYQMFADGEYIRVFHPSGVWESSDGKSWRQTSLTNIVMNQAFLDYVEFKGAVYALGTFEGNIERFTQTSQIARTTDFKNWEILAAESNLPKRFFYHPFVFQDKIWIIGGGDTAGSYADAWVSTDAVRWTKVADNLPFGTEGGKRFVVFKNKLYMLRHDVWVSSDGVEWTMLTPNIAQGDIFGYSVEVFDDKIWLIGCSRNGRFRSEVLYSSDGITWKEERAPWSPRGATATCIFRNQIIMTGGKYGGPGIGGQTEFVYSNDVWAMKKQ